ncbi:GAF domain-containing sensor histidine kinase [Bradyrhizobium canariense]|uniref:histidine kinase n=1 Tax=Bradyrhizobium canariense TaxID=255045 RepID=A0A1H2ADL0_9BRAD|nr:GAF domain-containing sensor histidine kinase [Bradyrhizobium canariense]SDT43576.1 Signal transduction histidine kinase [Bradyrhizobium canariense]
MATDLSADIAAVQGIAAVPRILEVVCRSTGMGFAAVARVTEQRWVCCAVRDEIDFGLVPGGELEVETTICHEIRQSHEAVVIDNVAEDASFSGHHTPAKYGFRSYISTPIILADGTFFGTLCAIDPRPARLNTPQTIGMFKLFAELIATHLEAVNRLIASEATLLSERETSELREQFIAVLGHDLRNPLASIAAGTKMLAQDNLQIPAGEILGLMQKSVARMSVLIDNVLDFARGRLGGGIALRRSPQSLEPVLNQVIAELRASSPGSQIETAFNLTQPVDCDGGRIAQLFSNLLGNSIAHGTAAIPVRVDATTQSGEFVLSVTNSGEPIPADAMGRLFQPFYRVSAQDSPQGLGLGLYIASEIARAHGGTIDVASSPEQTRFTFRMPLP